MHLAAYFQTLDKTVLIDGDPNRSSTAWKARGSLPFDVADEAMTAKVAGLTNTSSSIQPPGPIPTCSRCWPMAATCW